MIRQVRDLDHTIVAQCCGKGDGIVEFADIAWPAMAEEQQPRCARQRKAAVLRIVFMEQLLEEPRQILAFMERL